MSTATLSATPAASRALRPIPTVHIVLALVAASLLVNLVHREIVMSRAVHDLLLAGTLDGAGLERQWQLYERMDGWSYLAAPLVLLVQTGVVALLVQLALVLGEIEVPIGRIFRASLVAQGVFMAQMALTLRYQAGLELDGLSPEVFYRPLGAAIALAPGLTGAWAVAASSLTVFEMGWCVVLFLALRRAATVGAWAAGAVVGGMFVLFNAIQIGLSLYLETLGL